ncbi:hypothetical protein BsIDN1_60120 [Bacillus safensis]|uniref:ABC transmembrane type-1 domain-containing protein n=1 Tax=Bacillus safensis TaxID=561879 RepID=A0A5S9MJP2_BACIA|nr:hypothetical protein BsIDN1_60120 [Bacillus safensis]
MKLDLLPVEGIGTWEHLILPSITLAVPLIATYTRLLRSSVSEALQEPFVQYARIRGLKEQSIMFKHVFRIAISPMLTGLGVNLGKLLTGTIIVEAAVFLMARVWPLFFEAIFNRDLPVIQFYVLMSACIFLS